MSEVDLSSLTIIIPAFNEVRGCAEVVSHLLERFPSTTIVVVDDGSTDLTWQSLQPFADRITLHRHQNNRGYGAALKTGMQTAKTEFVMWFDADGQHAYDDVPKIAGPVLTGKVDAALGNRQKGSAFVVKRMPGKVVLKYVSQIIARRVIPDLNCGLRCFRREVISRYAHLLPNGYSASSTSTLLMLKLGYRIEFVPVRTGSRMGASKVVILRDGLRTLALLWKIALLELRPQGRPE